MNVMSPMHVASAPYLPARGANHLGYLLAALVVIVGIGIGVVYAVSGVLTTLSAPDHFDRTTVGGSLTATIENAGTVVIYVEAAVVPSLAQLDLTVTDTSGSNVRVRPYPNDLRYDRAGGLGTAVATFEAAMPGEYQIVSAAPRTMDTLAVGADIGERTIGALGRAGVICGLAILAGIALAAATKLIGRH